MEIKPEVSIITPFLNAESFIDEAISSVIEQTYNRWELILIDDGSTDKSAAIAHKHVAKYPEKIRYFCHEGNRNLGGSFSRNVGISNAKGKYIAFLDADDVYLSHKLEDQIRLLDSQPDAAMVYASTEYWYSWTGLDADENRNWVWSNFGVEPNTLVAPPRLLISFLEGVGTIPCMGSLLVRRDAIERVGGFENSFLNQYDDQVLYAKICLESSVFVAGGCWDRYRQHADSSCHIAKRTGEADIARHEYLNWLESYCREKCVADVELWGVLQKALRPYRQPLLDRFVRKIRQLGEKSFSGGLSPLRRALPASLKKWARQHLE